MADSGDAVRAGHALEAALPETAATVPFRARYVRDATPLPSRDARDADLVRRRLAFVRLVHPYGTAKLVAEAWGVSRTVVYQVKVGAKPLTNARIAALPPALLVRFRRLLSSLDGPVQMSFPGAAKW